MDVIIRIGLQWKTIIIITVVLAWVPGHVIIRINQKTDTLTKEATKMTITTLKLPFTDYKTKIKHYIRRKRQTLWDMFPNIKLYGHQPSIKLETREPLPNWRQDIILSRIRIGHSYLTHAYLLKGETVPQCTCCNQLLTVNHILVDCKKYEKIRLKSLQATNLTLLFKDIPGPQIIEYLKQVNCFQFL